jgi:uncharacterized membrane protein
MSENHPNQPPPPPAAANANGFNAAGRMVAVGRGWTWIAEAWTLFARQPVPWIVNGLVFALVVAVLPYTPPILGGIASAVLTPVFLGGLMLGADAVHRDQPLGFGHLFAGFQKNVATLLAIGIAWFVCLTVITFLAAFIMGFGLFATMAAAMATANPVDAVTSLFAIVMGSIVTITLGLLVALALLVPVAMMLWFAPALVVMHDMGAGAALKASFIGCLKNFVPFILYGLVMTVLSTVAAIPLMLGMLVLIPVTIASVYTGYRDIFLAR